MAARKSVHSARNMPAQSTRLHTRRSPKAHLRSFAAVGAARRGHSRGFQRANMFLIVITRALCASLVPRSASKERKRAGNLSEEGLQEASRSHVDMTDLRKHTCTSPRPPWRALAGDVSGDVQLLIAPHPPSSPAPQQADRRPPGLLTAVRLASAARGWPCRASGRPGRRAWRSPRLSARSAPQAASWTARPRCRSRRVARAPAARRAQAQQAQAQQAQQALLPRARRSRCSPRSCCASRTWWRTRRPRWRSRGATQRATRRYVPCRAAIRAARHTF